MVTPMTLYIRPRDHVRPASGSFASCNDSRLLGLYRCMLTSRVVDEVEMELVNAGEAFFHVSGAGHEASALLSEFLIPDDWLHLHYRDKALMLARGVTPEMFFHSLLCNAASHSAGRQMSAHMSDPDLHFLSTVGPVGNNALQAVGVASAVKEHPGRPIVVCSMGDGTTQQGEVMEAIAEAARSRLPVLFWIEDNAYSISTTTKHKTFYSLPPGGREPDNFLGLPIQRLEGRDVTACLAAASAVIEGIRSTRRAAIVIFKVERLCSHTSGDDERTYRRADDIAAARRYSDPIRLLGLHLRRSGINQTCLDRIEAEVQAVVRAAAECARAAPTPIVEARPERQARLELTADAIEYRGNESGRQLTMVEAIRDVLRERMNADHRVSLFGEDIEDPKGDVFGVTKGLTAAFPDRVVNSPLSESTIVGVSIGRALAGDRPVAFIQFADFLPLAFNQIISEMGSMYWRTDGGWQCPVILMVACGGYRPGLGPFHAQTLESVMAHVPGIDVLMPSSAGDAAGLLNMAFQSGRPAIYFYPKSCLNDPDGTTSADVAQQLVPLGKARHVSQGDDLTIVTWGSTVQVCVEVVRTLKAVGTKVDLLDSARFRPGIKKQSVSRRAAPGN